MRSVTGGRLHGTLTRDPRRVALRRAEERPTLEGFGFDSETSATLGRELLSAIRANLDRLRHVAFVIRADGVEATDRDELVMHYRRHGLRPLARRIRDLPAVARLAALVVEGEPETAVLGFDVARLSEILDGGARC